MPSVNLFLWRSIHHIRSLHRSLIPNHIIWTPVHGSQRAPSHCLPQLWLPAIRSSKTQSRCDLDLQNLKDGKTVMSMYLMKIDSLSARKEEIQREMRYHYYACVQRSWTNAGTIPPNFLHQIETVQPLCWKRWKQLPSLVRSSRLRGDAFNCTSNTNRCISRARKHCSRNPVDSGLETQKTPDPHGNTWNTSLVMQTRCKYPWGCCQRPSLYHLSLTKPWMGGASWENKLCA